MSFLKIACMVVLFGCFSSWYGNVEAKKERKHHGKPVIVSFVLCTSRVRDSMGGLGAISCHI